MQEARQKLAYLKMTKDERDSYDRHVDALMIQNDVIDTAREEGLSQGREEGFSQGREEGLSQGRAEGRAEGRLEEKLANARSLKSNGVPIEIIAQSLGLAEEDISQL